MITFMVGLICATVVGIFSTLYHKWKKIDSFKIFETNTHIIIKNNPLTNLLATISYFFYLSLFSFLIATNNFNLYVELSIIYLISLLLVTWNFVNKRNFIIVIDKETKEIVLDSISYKLDDHIIEVTLDKNWFSDETSYGLYLKTKNCKYILIYGHSVYYDIENLRVKLLERINGR